MSLQSYDLPFEELLRQVKEFSPQAAEKLQAFPSAVGAQAAYYAAFILVCIHASLKIKSYQAERVWTLEDVRGFTFFEHIEGDAKALAQFEEALNLYKAERSTQLGQEA